MFAKVEFEERTSEWLKLNWTFFTPLPSAADSASPCNVTVGTPASSGRISMSLIAAPAPLDATPSDLNTASLPAHRAANDALGAGCARQYAISASVKLRDTNVGFEEGTAEISSVGRSQRR